MPDNASSHRPTEAAYTDSKGKTAQNPIKLKVRKTTDQDPAKFFSFINGNKLRGILLENSNIWTRIKTQRRKKEKILEHPVSGPYSGHGSCLIQSAGEPLLSLGELCLLHPQCYQTHPPETIVPPTHSPGIHPALLLSIKGCWKQLPCTPIGECINKGSWGNFLEEWRWSLSCIQTGVAVTRGIHLPKVIKLFN